MSEWRNLVDAADLGSAGNFSREGSNPSSDTICLLFKKYSPFSGCFFIFYSRGFLITGYNFGDL